MPADTPLFRNNAVSQLVAAISGAATEIEVAPGDGDLFPEPDVYEYAVITVTDYDTLTREIMHVTGRTGDTLSVTRAQEGTSAFAFPAGAEVSMQITAGILEYLRDL